MTLNDYYQMEQDRKSKRTAVSLTPDGGARTDQGRTCPICGRSFRPTVGNRYCDECMTKKGEGW